MARVTGLHNPGRTGQPHRRSYSVVLVKVHRGKCRHRLGKPASWHQMTVNSGHLPLWNLLHPPPTCQTRKREEEAICQPVRLIHSLPVHTCSFPKPAHPDTDSPLVCSAHSLGAWRNVKVTDIDPHVQTQTPTFDYSLSLIACMTQLFHPGKGHQDNTKSRELKSKRSLGCAI